MSVAALVNGAAVAAEAWAIYDRGFNYGDGLFETARVRKGRLQHIDAHLERLFLGCARLAISPPDRAGLLADVSRLIDAVDDAVLKIVITRGAGGRGYRPPADQVPTRVLTLHPPPGDTATPIAARWCETRLGRNPALAGIKHLNRLEQVLAQSEWQDGAIAEGLMLDTEGELVSGTASNVFVVRDGQLATPDLRFCGVRGVMRGAVIAAASRLGIACVEEPLWPHDVEAAAEVFVTNAVRGLRPVAKLGEREWPGGPVFAALARTLNPEAAA